MVNEQVAGQEQIKEFIQKSVERNKVSHAYILCGEKGAGRYELARLFAATLQCTAEEGTQKPCGKCKSCKQMAGGNQPDVIVVLPEKNKKELVIDDIRNKVNNTILIKPYEGPYKVYIIPDADKLNVQSQNALLKNIEEPPEYAVLLLIAENIDMFLPTILSRCVVLNLKPVSETVIMEYLMNKLRLPDYMAHTCAVFAQGNIGKAVRYATDGDFSQVLEDVLRLLKGIDTKRIDELLAIIRKIKDNHYDINDYLDIMILWYRDVLLYKAVKDNNMLIFDEETKGIEKDAKLRSYGNLEACIVAIDKAKVRLDANVNFDITIELLLITLKEIW